MLNILPIQEKKRILTEYRLRLATVVVFAIAALIIASLVLLIPSYMLAVSKYDSISNEVASQQSKQDLIGQEKDIDVQVRAVNKKIDLFIGGASYRLSPPDTISKIIGMKSLGIKISGFDYDGTGPMERITVSGVAADRDGLAQFVDTLKKEPTFASVNLPVSSYVKSANIDFSIVIARKVEAAAVKK